MWWCEVGVGDVGVGVVKREGRRGLEAGFKKWAAVLSLTGQERLDASA